MGCMKCGRKVEETRLFCPECMQEMENYPVDPNTIVRLPARQNTSVAKKKSQRRRRFWSSENQIEILRARVKVLTGALIVMFLCFLLTVGMVIWLLGAQGYADFEWLDSLGL